MLSNKLVKKVTEINSPLPRMQRIFELQTLRIISGLLLLPIVSSILCKHSPKPNGRFDTFSVNTKTQLHDPTGLAEKSWSFVTSIELA